METERFDDLTRIVAGKPASRRGALKALLGGTLGISAGWLGRDTVTARKRRKKKQKPRCLGVETVCDPDAGRSCCAGPDKCCPPDESDPDGEWICAPEANDRGEFFCCGADKGGGWCSESQPLCCPPSRRFPGFCELAGGECCTDDPAGGSCPPGTHCCIDPESEPQATCCANLASAMASARARNAPRNYHRRRR